MKKTININLGGRIFHIEDDAFTSLDVYLNEVKTKFGTYPDSEEIIADIEARIAEHFEQSDKGKQETIISAQDVQNLIQVMGKADEFESDESSSTNQTQNTVRQTRYRGRLFRNPDDAILGGVASGIAAYFDWDPIWVRLAFAASVLLGGYTIILYIVLWIIVPAAESESDKLEMQGDAITLASLEKKIKEKVNSEKLQSVAGKAGRTAKKTFSNAGTVTKQLFSAAGKLFGALLMTGATIGFFAISFGLVVAIITLNSPNYTQFPIKEFFGNFQYYLLLVSGYFAALIPMIISFVIGRKLFDRTKTFHGSITIGLIAIWFVAVGAIGSIAVNKAPQYEPFVENHPAFRQTITDYNDLAEFTSIEASGDVKIKIYNGPTRVSSAARESEIPNLSVKVENNILKIDKSYESNNWCLLCHFKPVEVSISLEDLKAVTLNDTSNVDFISYNANSLQITATDATYVRGNINSETMILNLSGSAAANLEGGVKKLTVNTDAASRVYAEDLIAETAEATAKNASRINLNVTKTVKAEATDIANIKYIGGAVLTGNLRDPNVFRNDRHNNQRSQNSNTESEPEVMMQ